MFTSFKAYFITGLAALAVGFVALSVVTPVSADSTNFSLVGSVRAFFGMAPAPLPITDGGSITMFGSPLTENFDSLSQTGVSNSWVDNVTLLGGYQMLSTYTANDGSLTTAGMQSFGLAGVNPVTDRAWGSIPNNGTGDLYYGFKLTNNTGSDINSLAVTYTGEQWCDDNQLPQALVFEYQVANVGTITDANVPTTGWTPDVDLTFVSPVVTNNGAAIDGNAAANRTVISDLIVFTTPVANGQEIWIRWGDNNNFSQDPGLAIDDLTVIANAGTTPTPTATPTATPTSTPTATPTATPICATLSMPNSSSAPGVGIAVPVSITETSGLGIISVDFTFTYDPTVLTPVFLASPPTQVSTSPGTVGPTATVNANQLSPGVIQVSVFDSSNLSGEGVLLYINMNVVGNAGTSTPLTLTNVQYNGTLVCSTSSNGTHTVNAAATTTAVSSSMNPSVFGSMVTFTATVSSVPSVGNNGTVSFVIDGSPACTAVPVVSGIATCSTATLDVPTSPHSVVATYSGTVNFSSSNGTLAGGQNVTPASSTTAINCSPGTFVYTGSPITPCTATVTGAGGLSTTATIVYASNTDVGTATANASYPGDPNHTGSTATQVTFAITPASSTTVINCPASVVYTGSAQAPCTATVTGAGLNTTATVIYTNNINVGTATANATYAGDANHSGSTAAQVTFAITLASSSTVINCPVSVVYTGSALTPCTATVTGAGGLNTTATVIYTNNTNVGTATANASYAGDANHSGSTATQVTFAITAASSATVINCSPGTFVYTGSPITPCIATVTGAGGLNTTVSVVYASNTNVGTATANASYAGDANHTGSTATQVTFSITAASSTTVINCSPGTFVYTGSPITPCIATVTGAGGLNTTATVVYANNTNVGTATANATYAGDSNHTGSTATQVTFAITQASSSTVINCPVSVVYTGAPRTPCTATVTGAGGLNTTATVVYTNNTNVGTATANATYAGDTNHTGSTATQVTFNITAAASTTVINCPVSVIYNGMAQTPCTATVTGAGGLNTTATVVYTNNTNVGTATANATYPGDANHSGSTATQVTFSITAAAPSCTVTGYSVQYDAMPHTATGQCLGVVGETLAGLNLSGTTHTAIGNYPMDPWSFVDVTGNYTNTNGTVADAILSGTITGSVTYAIAPKPVPTVAFNAPGSVPVSGSSNAAGSYFLTGFGAGPYTVTPSKATQLCATSNGVFANDASLVAQHVVGLITLSPAQLLAAKVSGPLTPSLSSFDSGLIAQKVVNICSVVNLAGQWRFTPAFVDHPAGVTTDLTENYTAYMLGDVNGDWDPTAAAHRTHFASVDSKTAIRGSLPTMTASAGSDIVVPFRIDNLGGRPVSSYQFDVEYDPAVLTAGQAAASVTGTMSESLSVVSNSAPGLLKVAVYGALPVSGDGVFVNLSFSVNGKLGSATSLTITDLRINDGTDEVAVIEGLVNVGDVSGNMVRGRLLTSTGRAVANATVTLSGTSDALHRVVSNDEGRFEFSGLTIGETYMLSVSSKRFTFAPVAVSVTDAITQLEVIADQ